ncbi:[protein-PII] uridylyltransferase family protein [Arenibacterium sp. CAU 1754]
MSSMIKISRLPRPFAPELGAEAASRFAGLDDDTAQLIAGAGGSSPYLKGLIDTHSEWIGLALDDPETVLKDLLAELPGLAPDQLRPELRKAKGRVALLTALMDLAGAWPLERVTGILTDFAALACDLALKSEIATLIRRGKLPGQTEDDIETAAGLSVLAMGKMGAHELNYSSDIDLICLFDETRYDPDDFFEVRQAMVRATRNMSAILNDRTADGYVFRTDLRLRPDPSVTPVCLAMEAAERYYESLGRTWERAAYIKARACAGDIAAGEKFLKTLRPFVWRRHLDFAAIQDAHDMRLRIRESKGLGGPLTLPGHDMKLGRGGIREIEFFTQTRQLIAGGRDETLRVRGTVEGLKALASQGWVPDDVTDKLIAHYRAHREVEHRIQMVHDAQTHKLPNSDDEFERIACLMGTDSAGLKESLLHRLGEVHELTEGFFAPGAPTPPEAPETYDFDSTIMSRWPTYPAFRSQRAREIFKRLRPDLLARLARTAKPEESLVALDGFLAGLPAGVQLFSLFEANPHLIDLLVDIVGTSPALASHLSANSSVFDAVIGGDFFADWPGLDPLIAELTAVLDAETDYESRLIAARRWNKEWHFRIGVHHLRGLSDGAASGRRYADLAEAVVCALTPVVISNFARKHGPPPGRGAAVLGMGSLGAQRLNALSDLDLIVIYDPADAEQSDGPRPLATRSYYARLTQALITALTVQMAHGRLYEVDMRLRPSGNQGPVATSWASFRDYQTGSAWTWEHLALTRARVIASDDPELAGEIEDFRQSVMTGEQDRAKVLGDVADMRARIADAKSPAGVLDTKIGAGRMQDIELIAQAGTLLAGLALRDVATGLQGGVTSGWLSQEDASALQECHEVFWSVFVAGRLLSGKTLDAEQIGEGGVDFLCRSSGFESIQTLQSDLERRYDDAARRIEAILNRERD